MYNFDAKKVKDELVQWIRDWFEINGDGCNSVVGISGGVDSSVVAALCVEALGKDRVVGITMPRGLQTDIDDAYTLINHLGIKHYGINIETTVDTILTAMVFTNLPISEQTRINLPPRIRMATLYAVSQSANGRVANTSNLSESWVGYDTRYGDSVGDFSPLSKLTKTEVRLIGKELGLPDSLVNKTPLDGLCGKTDEESFGFSYEVLDTYLRTGAIDDENIKMKIDDMHRKNLFKLQPMPMYEPEI